MPPADGALHEQEALDSIDTAAAASDMTEGSLQEFACIVDPNVIPT